MLQSLINLPLLLPQGVLLSLARNEAEHSKIVNGERQGPLPSPVVWYSYGNNWFALETKGVLPNGKGMNRNLFSAELSTFSILFLLGGFVG